MTPLPADRPTHTPTCSQGIAQFCVACKTRVCACQGKADGLCPVCRVGYLSNYYEYKNRRAWRCGYPGCGLRARVASPTHRHACMEHAVTCEGYVLPPPDRIAVYWHAQPITAHSCAVIDAFYHEARKIRLAGVRN